MTIKRPAGRIGAQARLSARRRAVKAAWSQTGLDDATYRQMLREVAGVASSNELDMAGASKVLNHINATLGRSTPSYPGKPARVRPECQQLLGKIEAQLADMKLPWAYAGTILQHQGADRWEWATQLQLGNVVAALAIEQDKRQLLVAVTQTLDALGKNLDTGAAIARAYGYKGRNWQRDVTALRNVLQHLHQVGRKEPA